MSFINDWIEWLPGLLSGLLVSLQVTFWASILGFPLGLLLALLSISRHPMVRWPTILFVEIFRGIPLLVIIYLVYFGLPDAGLTMGALVAVVVAMTVNLGAYSSEIFRAGILSVSKGQTEASLSLGLTRTHELVYIVLPQALRAVPGPLMSQLILVFQATSLGFAVGLSELLNRAYEIGSLNFSYLSVLVLAGTIYAAISIVTSRAVAAIENAQNGSRVRT